MNVLIGPHGQHYHKERCANVTDSMTEVKRGIAEACEYTECGTCFGGDETPHCPECGRASVMSRHGVRGVSEPREGDLWRCKNCTSTFDNPDWLPANGHVGGGKHCEKLYDMDPDTEIVHPDEVEQ
jgi:ribosomal protein L37AE/L43A